MTSINWKTLSNEQIATLQFALERLYEIWRKEHHDDDTPTPAFWDALSDLADNANTEWNKRKLKYEMFVVGPPPKRVINDPRSARSR